MDSRGWDPGIGIRNRDDYSIPLDKDLVGCDTFLICRRLEGIWGDGIFRGLANIGSFWKRQEISLILTERSVGDQGNIFVFPFHMQGVRIKICLENSGKQNIWLYWSNGFNESHRFIARVIDAKRIDSLRSDITDDILGRKVMESWTCKGDVGLGILDIIFSHSSFTNIIDTKELKLAGFNMTQGQLLGTVGVSRNGEGTRKRLKISVAHFDNTELIKSCSKVLLGRCMNPAKQEMSALLTKLPKIWNLEDQMVGTDLGLGKFQFDFQREEDIEGVLKLQPYHFDYWMIAVAKWQPRRSS